MLKFDDGITIYTGGPDLRILVLWDGLYVVGRGMCIPVDTIEQAKRIISSYQDSK